MKALAALFISLSLLPLPSQAQSIFDPAAMELAIQDFYAAYAGDIDLTSYNGAPHELKDWAKAIASTIADYRIATFNDMVVLLTMDYCHYPSLRGAVELLAQELRKEAEAEIEVPHWAEHVFRDAIYVEAAFFLLWAKKGVGNLLTWRRTGQHVWKQGKAALETTGGTLTRGQKIKEGLLALASGYPASAWKAWGVPAGVAGAVGLTHAYFKNFQARKLDPLKALSDVECDDQFEMVKLPLLEGVNRSEEDVLRQLGIDPKQREELKELKKKAQEKTPIEEQLDAIRKAQKEALDDVRGEAKQKKAQASR